MRYPKYRKSPRRHQVKSHTREGRSVRSFVRGKGMSQQLTKKVKIDDQKEILDNLFNKQDSLIEHKFPTTGVTEYTISCAGDIYREMTRRYPHYAYINEKWRNLSGYTSRPNGFTYGDFEEIEDDLNARDYKKRRDKFLQNLRKLEQETRRAKIDRKRKQIMLDSLNMIKGTVRYIESGNPRKNPRKEYDILTGSISEYFPREFWQD